MPSNEKNPIFQFSQSHAFLKGHDRITIYEPLKTFQLLNSIKKN